MSLERDQDCLTVATAVKNEVTGQWDHTEEGALYTLVALATEQTTLHSTDPDYVRDIKGIVVDRIFHFIDIPGTQSDKERDANYGQVRSAMNEAVQYFQAEVDEQVV